jgi:hypothetical protein
MTARRGLLACALAAMLAIGGSARAEVTAVRPYDAPRLDRESRKVPDAPPEYLTHDGGWIRFAYHPSARERVRPLLGRADRIQQELTERLGVPVLASVDVRVAAVPAEMARLAPTEPPGYAAALAYSDVDLVVMSLSSPLTLEPPDLEDPLRHELAHLALDEAVAGRPVPRWFHEGFATWTSGENATDRVETLTSASLRRRLMSLAELEASFPADAPEDSLPYAEAADFVRFLAKRSPAAFRDLVGRLRDGAPFESALAGAYGVDRPALERAWKEDMARRYAFLPVLLGGLAAWIVVALAMRLARLRRRKKSRALAHKRARAAEAAPRVRPALGERERARKATARLLVSRKLREEMGEIVPPDAEVPKIEHDGRWHTLH